MFLPLARLELVQSFSAGARSCSEFQKAGQTAAERGEAELRILDFKTTWSEFQKTSQTAAERGEAELRILNFKTTWSEF